MTIGKKLMLIVSSIMVLSIVVVSIGLGCCLFSNENHIINGKEGISSKVGLNWFTVSIKVYKNGELVYQKEKDPVTTTFLALISEMLGRNQFNLNSVLGGYGVDFYGSYKPNAYIVFTNNYIVYNPSISYSSISDYIVAQTEKIVDTDMSFDDSNGGTYTLYFTKSKAFSISDTIYGIGVYTRLEPVSSSGTVYDAYNYLILYEGIQNGIKVNPGDVITVLYEIHFPMSSG